MHRAFRIVFLFLALLASEVFAQQSVVFSVPDDAWRRMSTRDDGKIPALSFSWGVSAPAPAQTSSQSVAATAGKPILQESVLVLAIGDPVTQFAMTALRGLHLPSVLVEFPLANAKPGGPAPFAARLTEVLVTSVHLSKSANDGGPGTAEIKLSAAKVELFTSTQDPRSGAVRGGAKAGFDAKAQRPL